MPDDHVDRNRRFWDADADAYQAAHGDELAATPLAWGVWRVPEAQVRALGDVRGRDVLELGCGGAQWSVALAACGARPVGLDLSSGQLAHARRHADAARVAVPLVQASGEAVPLRDAGFDVVFADHGAPSFCEPGRLVAEAARVLRPGGRFAFCATTPLVYLTWDQRRERQSRKLRRGAFGRRRFAFGEGTVDFVPSTGEWIRLFRRHGLTVEDVVELRPSEGATTTYVDFVPYRWARRWPAEQVWVTSRQR